MNQHIIYLSVMYRYSTVYSKSTKTKIIFSNNINIFVTKSLTYQGSEFDILSARV